MEKIRIGKDLDCRLTVLTDGETVSLEGDDITLVMLYPDNSKLKMDIEGIEENVIKFHISPSMQRMCGVYGFEIWKNVGSGHQTVCDRTRAFELVALSEMEGGSAEADFGTETVELTTIFSGGIVVVDNLDSHSTDAALSANMGRELKEMIEGLHPEEYETEAHAQEMYEEITNAINTESTARNNADITLSQAIVTVNKKLADYVPIERCMTEEEVRELFD